jgi:hypothetical protein
MPHVLVKSLIYVTGRGSRLGRSMQSTLPSVGSSMAAEGLAGCRLIH